MSEKECVYSTRTGRVSFLIMRKMVDNKEFTTLSVVRPDAVLREDETVRTATVWTYTGDQFNEAVRQYLKLVEEQERASRKDGNPGMTGDDYPPQEHKE